MLIMVFAFKVRVLETVEFLGVFMDFGIFPPTDENGFSRLGEMRLVFLKTGDMADENIEVFGSVGEHMKKC